MFNYSLRISVDIYNQSKPKQNKSKEEEYMSVFKKDQKNKRTKISRKMKRQVRETARVMFEN